MIFFYKEWLEEWKGLYVMLWAQVQPSFWNPLTNDNVKAKTERIAFISSAIEKTVNIRDKRIVKTEKKTKLVGECIIHSVFECSSP